MDSIAGWITDHNIILFQPGESGLAGVPTEEDAELSVDISTDDSLVVSQQQSQQSISASIHGAGVLPLDAAILRSIDQCPTEELKKKALASILLVGQGIPTFYL